MFINQIIGKLILFIVLFIAGLNGYSQPVPIIKSTSVTNESEVTIEWELPDGTNADGFVILHFIYRDESNYTGPQELVRINLPDARSYKHQNALPGDQREIYQVQSILNNTESIPSAEMQTVRIMPEITYDPCALNNTIHWTEFFQEFAPISYEIGFNTDGGRLFYPLVTIEPNELQLIGQEKTYGSFNNSDNLTGIYAYTHENIDPDQTYFYRVVALYGESLRSVSNIRSRNSPAYQRPSPPQLQSVSVNENGSVDMSIVADLSATTSGLDVYRSETDAQSLQLIQELQAPDSPTFDITDDQANTDTQAYFYQINLLDSCGKVLLPNETHRTIFLAGEIVNETNVRLNWNSYEGWPVEAYRVFRKIGENAFEEIGLTQTLQYTDLSLPSQTVIGKVAYYVEAFSNMYKDNAVASSSNRILLNFESELFVANAFRPDGNIATFKPVSRFEPYADYRFQIYNRWGHLMFDGTDPQQGWDGTFKGEKVQTGNYIWQLVYTNKDGQIVQKRGNVMLVR